MSSYYENVDKIIEDTEKNDRLNDIIIKSYFVICGIYLIPCLIQAIFFVDLFAVIDIIFLALVLFGGYMSCRTRSSKWCILTGLCMIYSIGFGDDNDTFLEKIIRGIGWHSFEVNALLFVPVILLIILTVYCNQKNKDLKIQHARYIERYREKEQRREIMERGEKKLRESMTRESESSGGSMSSLEALDGGGENNSPKNYMDEI